MHEEHKCRSYHCELTHVNPQTFKPHSAILALRRSRVSKGFWICVWRTTCSPRYTRPYSRRMHRPRCDNISQQHTWLVCTHGFKLQNNPRLWLKPWIVEFHLLTCWSYSIYRINLNNLGNLSAQKEIFDEIKLRWLFQQWSCELRVLVATTEKTWLNFLPL